MATITEAPAEPVALSSGRQWPARTVSVTAAVIGAAVVGAFGDPLAGATDGVAVTDKLVAAANPAMLAALLASFGCAALLLAAGRLADALTGVAGRVALAAGSLSAVLFALYYGAFGAAATVATMQFDTTSAGLGEATFLATNMISFGRYGAAFALLLAAAVTWRRRALPVWLSVVAGVLAVATALPFTSWIAALAVPVWLGVAGALARPRD